MFSFNSNGNEEYQENTVFSVHLGMRHVSVIIFNSPKTYNELLFTLIYRQVKFSLEKLMHLSIAAKNTGPAVRGPGSILYNTTMDKLLPCPVPQFPVGKMELTVPYRVVVRNQM